MNYIKIDSLSDNSRNSYSKLQQQQQQHVRESSRNFQDAYEDSNNYLITHKQNNLISKLNNPQIPIKQQHQQQQFNYSKTINTNSPFYITNTHDNVTPPSHKTLLNPQSNQLNNPNAM